MGHQERRMRKRENARGVEDGCSRMIDFDGGHRERNGGLMWRDGADGESGGGRD